MSIRRYTIAVMLMLMLMTVASANNTSFDFGLSMVNDVDETYRFIDTMSVQMEAFLYPADVILFVITMLKLFRGMI